MKVDHIPLDTPLDEIEKYIDFSELNQKYEYIPQDRLASCLVVDGAPIFEESKKQKFISVLVKTFQKKGFKLDQDSFFVPINEKSLGFFFVDCGSLEQANMVMQQMQMFPFDKKNVFQINKFVDIEHYSKVPVKLDDERIASNIIKKKELVSWLLDSNGRDQFAYLTNDKLGVYWNNKSEKPEIVEEKDGSEQFFKWSPLGTYLAAAYNPGVAFYGGEEVQRITRFVHPNVYYVDFSPLETFLVTFSGDALTLDVSKWPVDSVGHHIIIWHIPTNSVAKTFPISKKMLESKKSIPWPFFKWSADESFAACLGKSSKLLVYETQNFTQVMQGSENTSCFEFVPYFHPKDKKKPPVASLCYFVPAQGHDFPAQIVLLDTHTTHVLKKKQIFYGLDGKVSFSGPFMMFQVQRTNKSGKANFSSLEIFNLTEKNFPCDSIDINNNLLHVEIEPNGTRIAVISSETKKKELGNTLLEFYQMKTGSISKIATYENKSLNHISFCPSGRFVVCCGLKEMGGKIEVYDLDFEKENKPSTYTRIFNDHEFTTTKKVEKIAILSSNEQQGLTHVSWDPTGRYFASVVLAAPKSVDHGYMIWTFSGTLLLKQPVDNLRQFHWRPRPPTILSLDEIKVIRDNLGSYIDGLKQKDIQLQEQNAESKRAQTEALIRDFMFLRSSALLNFAAISESKIY